MDFARSSSDFVRRATAAPTLADAAARFASSPTSSLRSSALDGSSAEGASPASRFARSASMDFARSSSDFVRGATGTTTAPDSVPVTFPMASPTRPRTTALSVRECPGLSTSRVAVSASDSDAPCSIVSRADDPDPCAPEVRASPIFSLGAREGAREKMSLGLTPRIKSFMDAMDDTEAFLPFFDREAA